MVEARRTNGEAVTGVIVWAIVLAVLAMCFAMEALIIIVIFLRVLH